MFRTKYKIICFLFFVIIALNGCSKKENDEYITIGALLPLTGESLDEGLRALNGLQLAKIEINENGGINGKKLDIIVLNDKSDEEHIVKQYEVLKQKGVVAVIGSSYSGVTIALAKAAEKDGMPIISPTASNPLVTMGRPNVFRAIFIDEYQAEYMAKFASSSLDAKTALVLYDRNNSTFKQTAEFFAKTFKSNGGEVIAMESHGADFEYTSILKKYMNKAPDVIYYPVDYVPASKLVNTAFKLGFSNTKILGSDAYDGILAYVHDPEAMKNVYYTAPFSIDNNDPVFSGFIKKFSSAFSQMPLAGSTTAYTCVYILAEAIKTAGTDKNAIISAMKSNEVNTVMGKIKFDENNNPNINVYIIRIVDGIYSTFQKLGVGD